MKSFSQPPKSYEPKYIRRVRPACYWRAISWSVGEYNPSFLPSFLPVKLLREQVKIFHLIRTPWVPLNPLNCNLARSVLRRTSRLNKQTTSLTSADILVLKLFLSSQCVLCWTRVGDSSPPQLLRNSPTCCISSSCYSRKPPPRSYDQANDNHCRCHCRASSCFGGILMAPRGCFGFARFFLQRTAAHFGWQYTT